MRPEPLLEGLGIAHIRLPFQKQSRHQPVQQILAQITGRADVFVQEGMSRQLLVDQFRLGVYRQILFQILQILGQGQAKQPRQAQLLLAGRRFRRLEDPHAHGVALVRHGRKAIDFLPVMLAVEHSRQLAEIPDLAAGMKIGLTGQLLKVLAGIGRVPALQFLQVARAVDHLIGLVDHGKIHAEMLRQHVLAERLRRHGNAPGFLQCRRELRVKRALTKIQHRQHPFGVIRHRHEMDAQGFRQRLDQRRDLLAQQTRHQPAERVRIQLIEEMQRNDGGDAILLVTRLEAVLQRNPQRPQLEMIGKIPGIQRGIFLGGDIADGQLEQIGIALFRALAPALEGHAVAHVRRNSLVEIAIEPGFVHQQIHAPAFLLQVIGLGQQLEVVQEERRLAVVVHLHQGMTDEQLARLDRVDALVGNLAAGLDGQAEQQRALMHGHPCRLALPVRIVMLLLDQMRADLLDPFRLDLGDRASVDLGRLHLLG